MHLVGEEDLFKVIVEVEAVGLETFLADIFPMRPVGIAQQIHRILLAEFQYQVQFLLRDVYICGKIVG